MVRQSDVHIQTYIQSETHIHTETGIYTDPDTDCQGTVTTHDI